MVPLSSGRYSLRDYNNENQFLTYRKWKRHSLLWAHLTLGQMTLCFPFSDLRLWVEHQWQFGSSTLWVISDRQEHEEDAGIDEGYGEPKERCSWLEWPWGSCASAKVNGRRSAYSLHTPCPYTQELLYPCVKVCQQLSTWSVWSPLHRRKQSIQERC